MVKSKKMAAKTKSVSLTPIGFEAVLESIVDKIKAAQIRAMVAVNHELIEVYRDIGRTIYEQLQTAKWGQSVVEQLAKDLQNSFPGMKGFSSRNLWRMKDFYLSYCDSKKLTTLSSEISWSHNVAILSKYEDLLEREFYMKMSRKNSWSYRVLLN